MRARERTARRYAKALHGIAREGGAAEAVGREIEAFFQVLVSQPEARDVLTRPWIKAEDRGAIAATLAERAGCGQLMRDFVGLLAERHRMDHLPEIVAIYRGLIDEDLGQARAQVRAAVRLTDGEKRQIGARLERAVGKRIILDEHVDSTLLGGFVAQVGSLILDGSLDGQLERMRERLARG